MSKFLMKVVPAKVATQVGKKVLFAKKNSPHIFFGLGIVGSIASTYLACRATLKLSDTLDEIQKEVQQLKPNPEILLETQGSDELIRAENPNRHRDTIRVYGISSLKILKLYAPAITVGAVSIAALTGSHVQLARRNTALMAAYAAVQRAYDEYRNRVREEVGEERELELYHAASKQLVQNSDGNIVEAMVVDPNRFSPFAKFFDEYSSRWKKDPELNRIYLETQQAHMNDRLNWYGHLFLNEVYDTLDIPRTKAGQVVGWIKKGNGGDGYVSFNIFKAYSADFVNGNNPSILLDFNVDGVIYDKIEDLNQGR